MCNDSAVLIQSARGPFLGTEIARGTTPRVQNITTRIDEVVEFARRALKVTGPNRDYHQKKRGH